MSVLINKCCHENENLLANITERNKDTIHDAVVFSFDWHLSFLDEKVKNYSKIP